MKNILYCLLLTVCLSGCDNVEHKELLGFWKSDKLKTLDSMSKAKDITPETLEIFEGDFFGKLIVEFKENTYRAKFPNEEDNIDEFYEYYPYKIIEKGNNYYLVESYNHFLEENEIKKMTIEGDCYFVPVSKWNFNEYFCRI